MRRILLLLPAALLVLTAAVAVRTARSSAPRREPAGRPEDIAAPPAQAIAAHLAEAVRFRTVSAAEGAPPPAAELEALRAFLERAYPRVHTALSRELVAGHSLLYSWRGSDPSLPPLLLMAHLDVVPVEPGTDGKWTHPPFSGDVAEGFVWGRGTLDDKGNAIGELEAVEQLLSEGAAPKRTVLLAFGHDEEVQGSGAKEIAALLARRGVRPAIVLDEGGAVTEGLFPGVDAPIAIVGTAEKGYQSVELVAEGVGGHSSMPPRETATGIVAAGVARLEAHPLPARLTPVVRGMLERLAPHTKGANRVALANLWLFRPFVLRLLSAEPQTDAMIRTTTAPTMLEGSPKDNVLPQRARAVVNFRLLPGDRIADVLEHVRKTVNDPRITVRAAGHGSEASPISPSDSPEFALLSRTVEATFPGAVVTPYLVLGGTDARHYASIAANVFRFSPLRLRNARDKDRVHGTDERAAVEDLQPMVRFYVRLVREMSSPASP